MRKDESVVVEQTFDVAPHAVWTAITSVDQMRQWFFEPIPAFEAVVGFQTQFTVHAEGRDFIHLWKVTDVVPSKKVVYNWKYAGYPGDSFVEFELSEAGTGTKLKLTHRVTESFPADASVFSREKCVEGWTYFIQGGLKEFLMQP